MNTQTIAILAVLVVGFVALGILIRGQQASRDNSGDIAKALVEAQSRLGAFVEDRLRTADTAIREQVGVVTKGLTDLHEKSIEWNTKRAEEVARLDQATADTKQAVSRLNEQTSALSSAMSGTKARGNWGEFTLQRLIEMVGLQEHIDFVTQREELGEGTGRPDARVHLPSGRVLYIDAKVPWSGYQKFVAEENEELASGHMAQHLREFKKHIDDLSKRDYRKSEQSLDYVVMFVPVEAALNAALTGDPDLVAYAGKQGVVLASPLTLIVILTNFAKAWSDHAAIENVDAIFKETDELVKRLGPFVGHLAKVGDHIDKAGESFNAAVASYTKNIPSQVRKIEGLRKKGLSLPEIREVDFEPTEFKTAARDGDRGKVEQIELPE